MLFKTVLVLCAALGAHACYLKDAKFKVTCPVNENHVVSWQNLLNGLKPVWNEDIKSKVDQANEALKSSLYAKITTEVHKCEDAFDHWKQQQKELISHELSEYSVTMTKQALDIANVVAKNRELERANNKLSSSVSELTQVVNQMKQRGNQLKENNDDLTMTVDKLKQKVDQLVLQLAQWEDPLNILRLEQEQQRQKDIQMKMGVQGQGN